MTTTSCCGECGKEGGASLKACKACMQVTYCNAECQKNHWPTHKTACKLRVAELRDEALFKDPPAKEECPICFLPMPKKLLSCISLPPATISSIPIYDFMIANMELVNEDMEEYYPCCGKSNCRGCAHSSFMSGNYDKCPFCNSNRRGKTDEEMNVELMERVEANDATSICRLAYQYHHGLDGIQQDQTKAMELYAKSADLGCSKAHFNLGYIYYEGGAPKKAKFHYEAAAMAGDEVARDTLGVMEAQSGNIEQAVKHWTVAASAGDYIAMHELRICFDQGDVISRESINTILVAYNSSCAEMRSEARDACIGIMIETD